MTKPKRGYYSLIQFCPDPSRAEAVNLGVLLFCPEASYIAARTSANNRRATKLVGREAIDSASLNAAKRSIERRLEVDRAAFQTLEDLQRFVETRANILKLTPPRPVKVFDPPADLETLFNELVGGRARTRAERTILSDLDSTFRRLKEQGRARLDWTIDVPIVRRGLRIPYAYKNGIWNLVRPQVFPRAEGAAIDLAERLAINGDLLHQHSQNDEGPKQLIVVSTFADRSALTRSLEDRIVGLFNEYNVKPVRQEEIAGFIAQVVQEAHV